MAAKFDLIIKNGIVATAGDVGKYDIAVKVCYVYVSLCAAY